ncbi:MAG: sugar ABC transporter permease [Lachnospiraceae bacterium]|nr:sugar ABC transporter permease [Lachnospiraceae bacterium]
MNMKERKVKPSKRMIRESISMGMLAIPGIIFLLIFEYLPIFGIVIAFKNFKPLKGIMGSDWCGLDNFKYFFTSNDALVTIRNTVLYNVAWLILGTICSVGLALMFYSVKNGKALKVYNTVMIMPKFLSAVLLSFVAEMFLNYRYGYLNQIMDNLGGGRIDWYTKPEFWPFILTIVQVWSTVGVSSMIYYAALMSLDESLLEAARVDGANKVRQIWHVMLPHLTPIIVIQNIISIGHMFSSNLDLFYQVPQNVGLLYPATDVINTYTFRTLQQGHLARAAAVGLAQSVAGFVLVVITNGIVKKVSPENRLY